MTKNKPRKEMTNVGISKLTGDKLQNTLWQILNDLLNDRIDCTRANSISKTAMEICRIEKIKIDFYRMTGVKPKKSQSLLMS